MNHHLQIVRQCLKIVQTTSKDPELRSEADFALEHFEMFCHTYSQQQTKELDHLKALAEFEAGCG